MAKYLGYRVQNPSTGRVTRLFVYAPDVGQANGRVNAWLGSNPFSLGSTDFNEFMQTWNPTPVDFGNAAPDRQGGDIYLDFPTADTGGGTGGDGDGGFIGPPQELPEEEIRARFLQGLQQRGVNLGSISGRAMAQQEDE